MLLNYPVLHISDNAYYIWGLATDSYKGYHKYADISIISQGAKHFTRWAEPNLDGRRT